MRALDLFCGAGGASLGLEAVGCEVVGHDNWQVAVDTHLLNLGSHSATNVDLMGTVYFPAVDIIWASPPCQPFSESGHQRGRFDPRDGLPAVLHAVAQSYPRLVVIENVRGLSFNKNRRYVDHIQDELERLTYVSEWRMLNCADYGVPQTRQRFFLVAVRCGHSPTFPTSTHDRGTWNTMADALGWDEPNEIHPEWAWTRPSTTVCGDARVGRPGRKDFSPGGESAYAKDAAKLTVREMATLQGFPSWFDFTGTVTEQRIQVGNAVPPIMASAIIKANQRVLYGNACFV